MVANITGTKANGGAKYSLRVCCAMKGPAGSRENIEVSVDKEVHNARTIICGNDAVWITSCM
jgi:hypothetical protein